MTGLQLSESKLCGECARGELVGYVTVSSALEQPDPLEHSGHPVPHDAPDICGHLDDSASLQDS